MFLKVSQLGNHCEEFCKIQMDDFSLFERLMSVEPQIPNGDIHLVTFCPCRGQCAPAYSSNGFLFFPAAVQ